MPAYKEQIQRFYRKYAPGKPVDADQLLKKYKGSESALLSQIYIKYLLPDDNGGGIDTTFEDVVTRLYLRYAPDKSEEVPHLLAKYQANPDKLITGIVNKYEFHDSASSTAPISYKSQLTEVYRTANPEKVAQIDTLLHKYRGREADLLRAVKKKYRQHSTISSTDTFKARLTEAYRKYNPVKVSLVDGIAAKYKGNQSLVLAAIAAKYHPKRSELERLYSKYNPEKLSNIDQLLIKYKGNEEKLILEIKAKYEGMGESSISTPSYVSSSSPAASSTSTPLNAEPPVPTPIVSAPLSVAPNPIPPTLPLSAPPVTTAPISPPITPVPTQVSPPVVATPPTATSTSGTNPVAAAVSPSLSTTSQKKPIKAKPKSKKKVNLKPVFIILAIILVLGGAVGGYYYKFGWTIPFSTDNEKENTKKSENENVTKPVAKETKKEVAEEVEVQEVPALAVEKGTNEGSKSVSGESEVNKSVAGEKVAPIESTPKAKPKAKPKAITPVLKKKLKFHLAAGSFTLEQNARDLHAKLKSQGYKSVYLGRVGEYYKVSYQSFSNEGDARAVLQTLKDKGISTWVLKHELK